MNLVDEVTLNDYEKYRKYRRWPWKLIWHAALIALVSAQSLIYVTEARPSSAEHLIATKALRLHSYGLDAHCR